MRSITSTDEYLEKTWETSGGWSKSGKEGLFSTSCRESAADDALPAFAGPATNVPLFDDGQARPVRYLAQAPAATDTDTLRIERADFRARRLDPGRWKQVMRHKQSAALACGH
jgi:hypothetical protein